MDIRATVSRTFDLVFPRICLVCERPLACGSLCLRCLPEPSPLRQDLAPWRDLPFSSLFSMWTYQRAARRFITAMKYRPSIRLAQAAASELARCMENMPSDGQIDLIVCVPSSRGSFRRRLFNPVVPACKALSSSLGIPWSASALLHCGYGAPQASLPHTRRLRNVRRAFKAHPGTVQGKRILLIDDVVTTGATLAAAAQALRQAGCTGVEAAAFAQVPAWTDNIQALLRHHRGSNRHQ